MTSRGWRRAGYAGLLGLALVAFLWTFSGSGFLIAAVMLVGTVRWLRPGWLVLAFSTLLAAVGSVFVFFPENYFVASLAELWKALSSADLRLLNESAMVFVFSLLGPLCHGRLVVDFHRLRARWHFDSSGCNGAAAGTGCNSCRDLGGNAHSRNHDRKAVRGSGGAWSPPFSFSCGWLPFLRSEFFAGCGYRGRSWISDLRRASH